MYVYKRSEPGLYTVGFYDPSSKWHAESDHTNASEAAARVAWLNGSGISPEEMQDIRQHLSQMKGKPFTITDN